MSSRFLAAACIVSLVALAGCSTQPTASDPTAAQETPSATASAAGSVTKEDWLAALNPGDSSAILALLALPGAAQHIDRQDSEGMTALLYATQSGDVEAVAALLDAGADPAQRTLKGTPVQAAIHIAAANGDVAMLETLLSHGVDVNMLDGGRGHALMWAAYKGHAEAAQLLIDAGADLELEDGTYMNAAERAEDAGHTDVAALIRAAMAG